VADRVVLRLKFQNTSAERVVWVKRAPLVYGEGAPITDVWLDVRDSAARRILPNCRVRPGVSAASDYLALAPLTEFSTVVTLDCFALESGRYGIVAHYKDSGRGLPPPSPRATWFRGELTSETIDIEIARAAEGAP
jgi:hypothetical protein